MPRRIPTWDLWSMPPRWDEMDELQFIVMGTEHGRDRGQPSWDPVNMPLWMIQPPEWKLYRVPRSGEDVSFFGLVLKVWKEVHGEGPQSVL